MRDERHGKSAEDASGADDNRKDSGNSEDSYRNRRRRSRDRARAGAFGEGGGPFGGGFNPGQLLQMLPLMMAMGGGMPGAGMAHFQLRVMMWAIETWLDYLAAMQEVLERAFDRLRDIYDMEGGDGDGGKDW